ncbi:MAG: MBOAT family protein [Alphaproteobacteria bacterium]|nr:MBOAT family protein [Alphaproteobacteria bacterium]
MIFTTAEFALFFAAAYPLFLLLRRYSPWRWTKLFLTVISLASYAFWYYPYLLILVFVIVLDYCCGERIQTSASARWRKFYLVLSLSGNLGLLGFYKYIGFLSENTISLASFLGLSIEVPILEIMLPIGISFHTFQGMSYTIDIYRRICKPANSFWDFALFVSFFPQLVAGPVVRAKTFLPQLAKPTRLTGPFFYWGCFLLILGTFKKLVIADNLAPYVDYFYSLPNYDGVHAFAAWSAVMAYAVQIYTDFSGYSDIAIGLACLMGFRFPMNFYYPYIAFGFSDFWRRWHISLSTWFRDYLYVPLGGSRLNNLLTLRNLIVTMIIGGLWHGASWLFVLWGLLHGLFLVLDHLLIQPVFKQFRHRSFFVSLLLSFVIRTLTFVGVAWAWVFFRSQNIPQALGITKAMFTQFGEYSLADTNLHLGQYWGIVFLMHLFVLYFMRDKLHRRFKRPVYFVSSVLMIVSILLFRAADSNAFIYFQF